MRSLRGGFIAGCAILGLSLPSASNTSSNVTPAAKPNTPLYQQQEEICDLGRTGEHIRDGYTIFSRGDDVILLPRGDRHREFVFNGYQRVLDASNLYPATLECHEGAAYKSRMFNCDITITPCEKAALKETSNNFR